MLLDTVLFEIRPGAESEFETAFAAAQRGIEVAAGYEAHELQRSIEREQQYLLLIERRAVAEVSAPGYGSAADATAWYEPLAPYLATTPRVEHYKLVAGRGLPANPPPVINCD